MNEREIVLEALLLYNKKEEYADNIMSDILSKYAYLEKQERGFINRLFDGVIEREITLDYIINLFSSVKVNKQKPVIRSILRMGVYQIFYMDQVPDFAAINESVKLAKKKKFVNLSGFINGVLRNISKNKDSIEFPSKDKDFIKYLSVTYSCPEWIVKHFIDETSIDSVEKVIGASLGKQILYGRVNLSKISRDDLIERLKSEGVIAKKCDELACAIIIESLDNLSDVECFNEGLFVIQDLSSQFVLGKADVKKGQKIIDVCASPGGKTLHALDLSAEVVARDISEKKALKIAENIERCGFETAKVEVRDALLFDEKSQNTADILIADLPCSGLGVIGRKCDIKYRLDANDFNSLQELQRNILNTVYGYVKTGGMMVFSTCTVNKKENEDNVAWILDNLPFELIGTERRVQGIDNSDGFFIARFIKR